MLAAVKVPVMFAHHFRNIDEETGRLQGPYRISRYGTCVHAVAAYLASARHPQQGAGASPPKNRPPPQPARQEESHFPMQTPALIDVHAHFVTENYIAEAKAAGHEHPDGMPTWPEWSAEAHLELMDRAGIQTSVLSISSPGTHFGDDRAARAPSREVNEFAAQVREKHPTRFGHFASLPLPDVTRTLQWAGRITTGPRPPGPWDRNRRAPSSPRT